VRLEWRGATERDCTARVRRVSLWPTLRSDPCELPPIISVMRRAPRVSARAIRWAEPLRLPIRNSTDPCQGSGRNRGRHGGARERGVTASARYIATAPALADLIAELRRAQRIGVDTEAASFHRYRDRIYLVQVSSPTETALIDPLAIADLTPVGALLADPHIEKVFHDSDYDLRVLDRDYGFRRRAPLRYAHRRSAGGRTGHRLAALLEKYAAVKRCGAQDGVRQHRRWSGAATNRPSGAPVARLIRHTSRVVPPVRWPVLPPAERRCAYRRGARRGSRSHGPARADRNRSRERLFRCVDPRAAPRLALVAMARGSISAVSVGLET